MFFTQSSESIQFTQSQVITNPLNIYNFCIEVQCKEDRMIIMNEEFAKHKKHEIIPYTSVERILKENSQICSSLQSIGNLEDFSWFLENLQLSFLQNIEQHVKKIMKKIREEYSYRYKDLHDCRNLIDALNQQDAIKTRIEQNFLPLFFNQPEMLQKKIDELKDFTQSLKKTFEAYERKIKFLFQTPASSTSRYRNFMKDDDRIYEELKELKPQTMTNIVLDISQNDKIIKTQNDRSIPKLPEILKMVFSHRKLNLLHLNISFADLDQIDESMKQIGTGLFSLTYLQSLRLDFSYTRIQSLNMLSKGFKLNNNLKSLELNLSNTNINTMDDLMENLISQNKIWEFHLDVSNTKLESIDCLSPYLQNLKELKNLTLNFNCCNIDKVEILSQSFKNLRQIKHLFLMFNGTQIEQAVELLQSVGTLSSLTEASLDFSCTPLSSLPKIEFMSSMHSFSLNLADTMVDLNVRKNFRSLAAYQNAFQQSKGISKGCVDTKARKKIF